MATPELKPERTLCPSCAAEVAPGLLVCPACHSLVHSERLKRLAADAESAEKSDDPRRALMAWREALDLLPPESVQSKRIGEKAAELSRRVDALPIVPSAPRDTSTDPRGRGAWWAAAGGIGLLLWKFKFIVVFVLSKLKLLLFGLSKTTTLFSMMASAGLYWTIWGWPFALGIVGSIYIHEMGHVAALQRLGIKATAPMFIPGLGAFIRMKQYPTSVREDAYVGLAGPLWGMAAAIGCFVAWLGTGYGLWAALAEWGGRVNLFNLLPVASLDGSHGLRALNRPARWVLLAIGAVTAWFTGEGMLYIVLLVMFLRTLADKNAPAETDRRAFVQFALLLVVLALLSVAPLRMGAHAAGR